MNVVENRYSIIIMYNSQAKKVSLRVHVMHSIHTLCRYGQQFSNCNSSGGTTRTMVLKHWIPLSFNICLLRYRTINEGFE